MYFIPPLNRGQCSQISHVTQIARYHEMNSTPFRLHLEAVSNHSMQHQNNQNFCPSFGSVFFSFQPSLLVYLSVTVKKQQLVTPYGRERRGHFEHLPAWTPPYAVEFACLLSLINEKRRCTVFPISISHLFSVFVMGGRGTHSLLRLWVSPSACLSGGQVC